MNKISIAITNSDNPNVRVHGEVKAVDVASSPTIASVTATKDNSDTFSAVPGAYLFQFTVEPRCHVRLAFRVDADAPQLEKDFDATVVNAGRRYRFEVPS